VQVSRRSPEAGLIRRWVEALAFVGVWTAAGELLDMSTNAYLLFGIPLTAGFQLFVRIASVITIDPRMLVEP
jgi:hypothetical protein